MIRTAFALAALLAATIPDAGAASFDCAEAEAPDEAAICKIPELSELDTKMGALWFTYRRIPFQMGGGGARIDEAEAFLRKRRDCGGNEDCLRAAYQGRIKALEEGIDRWFMASTEAADAPQWSTATLPRAVGKIASGYASECRELGGTLASGFDRPMVMTGDIDGDSIQDFVVNPQNMQCDGAATAFCGNGGCDIALALSSNGYADPIEILGGAPTLGQNEEEGTFLDVSVNRSNCEDSDVRSACIERYTWKRGKLAIAHLIGGDQD